MRAHLRRLAITNTVSSTQHISRDWHRSQEAIQVLLKDLLDGDAQDATLKIVAAEASPSGHYNVGINLFAGR